jgi:signal transduction histidine kinase
MSIRTRLLLLMLAVLLPGMAAALWIVNQTYAGERQAIEHRLTDTTRALSMVVEAELNQRVAIAQVLATSELFDQPLPWDAGTLNRFRRLAQLAVQGVGGGVVLSSAAGELLDTEDAVPVIPAVNPPPNPPPNPPLDPPLDPPVSAPAPVPGLQASASAMLREAAPPAARLPSSGTPERLFEVPHIGGLEPRSVGGELRALIVQPVLRDGRAVFNVAVTVRPNELQKIVDRQRLPSDWNAAVLDPTGTLVARYPGNLAYAGRAATPDLKTYLAKGSEGLFHTVTLDGNPVTGYFSTSPLGWTYVTAMPPPSFIGLFPNTVQHVVIGALALLALAMVGTLWVVRGITRPVLSLTHAAAQMQAGEPVDRRPTGSVECDSVNTALANAADAQRSAKADLQQQVSNAVAITRDALQRASHSERLDALGRFTGGVAHDFNNLFGIISNSAHLIERHATGPALQVPVAATLRAVEVGSRLTRHLLRFSARQPVRPQTIHLQQALPDARELLQTVVGSAVQVTVTVAPHTERVTVDANELELALTNLAFNARDALPNGGQLHVEARNAEADESAGLAPGRYVLVTVSDDGKGISDDLIARVFEPFFTTKADGPGGVGSGVGGSAGTGFSLAQVLGFCVQAGGTARIDSTVGLGSTVSMLLPSHQGEAVGSPAAPTLQALPARAHKPVAASMPRPVGRARPARVLLVEDNAALAEVTTALLETFGYRVQHAIDPAAALVLLAHQTFDVVLSDIVMPGAMDGVALAHRVRAQWPRLPVVLITGYSNTRVPTGEFDVLHKPCSPEQLVDALHRAVVGSTQEA